MENEARNFRDFSFQNPCSFIFLLTLSDNICKPFPYGIFLLSINLYAFDYIFQIKALYFSTLFLNCLMQELKSISRLPICTFVLQSSRSTPKPETKHPFLLHTRLDCKVVSFVSSFKFFYLPAN